MVRRTSRAPRARLARTPVTSLAAFGCVALLATATGQGGGFAGPGGGSNGGRTREAPHDPPAGSRPRPPAGGPIPTRATRSSMRYDSDPATCGPYCTAWFGDCYARTFAEGPRGTAHPRAVEACLRDMYQAMSPPSHCSSGCSLPVGFLPGLRSGNATTASGACRNIVIADRATLAAAQECRQFVNVAIELVGPSLGSEAIVFPNLQLVEGSLNIVAGTDIEELSFPWLRVVNGALSIRAANNATLHSVVLPALYRVDGGVTIGGDNHEGVLHTVHLGLDVPVGGRGLGLAVDVDLTIDAGSNADAAIHWVDIGPILKVGHFKVLTRGGTIGNVSSNVNAAPPMNRPAPLSQLGGLRVSATGGGRIGTVNLGAVLAITARPNSEAVVVEATAQSQIDAVHVHVASRHTPPHTPLPGRRPIRMVISGAVRVFGAAGHGPAVYLDGVSSITADVDVNGPTASLTVNTVPVGHGADVNACDGAGIFNARTGHCDCWNGMRRGTVADCAPSLPGPGPAPPLLPWTALWAGGASLAEQDCRTEATTTIHTRHDVSAITPCVQIRSLHIEELSTRNAWITLPFLVTATELTLVANPNGIGAARFPRLTAVFGRLTVSAHPGADVSTMEFKALGYVLELHIHISHRATIGQLVFARFQPLEISRDLSMWVYDRDGSDAQYDAGTVGNLHVARLRSVANVNIHIAAGQVQRIVINADQNHSDQNHSERVPETLMSVANGIWMIVGPNASVGAVMVSDIITLPSLRISSEGALGRFALNAPNESALNLGELVLDGDMAAFVAGQIASIDPANVGIDLHPDSTATINGLLVSAEGIRGCGGLGTQQADEPCACFDRTGPVYGSDGMSHCLAAEAAVEHLNCSTPSTAEAPNFFNRPGWGLCVYPQGSVALPTCAGGSTQATCSYPVCTGGASLHCGASTPTPVATSTTVATTTTVAATTPVPAASPTPAPTSPMSTPSDGTASSTVAATSIPPRRQPTFTVTFLFEGLSSTESVVHGLLLHDQNFTDIVSISPIRIDRESGSASLDVVFTRGQIAGRLYDLLAADLQAGNISVVTCRPHESCMRHQASGMVIGRQSYTVSPSDIPWRPATSVAASSSSVVWSNLRSSVPTVTPAGATTTAGENGTVTSNVGKSERSPAWNKTHLYLAGGLGALVLFIVGVVIVLKMTTPASRKRGHDEAMALDSIINVKNVAHYDNNTSFATNPNLRVKPEDDIVGINSTDIDEYLSSIESPSGENYLSEDSTGHDAAELGLDFDDFDAMDIGAGDHGGVGSSLCNLSTAAPAIPSNSAVPTATAVLYDEPDVGALFTAVVAGDIPKLKELRKAGANFNIRNRSGQTALGFVCMGPLPNLDVMACLLDSGAQVNQSDKEGTTPLMFVARTGHRGAFALIMSKQALAACTDAHGMNAIMYAAINNHTEILSALVDQDPTIINARDHIGRTALHWAAAVRSASATEVLIQFDRIDPVIVDDKNESALHVACRLGETAIVELLISIMRPAKVREVCEMASFHGGMPSELAAARGHSGIAALLDAGTAPGRRDPAMKKRPRIFSAAASSLHLESASAPSSPDSTSSAGGAAGKGGRREYMRYRRKQQQSEIHVMQSVVDNLESEHVDLTEQVMALRAEAARLQAAQTADANIAALPPLSAASAGVPAEGLDASILSSVWQMLGPAVATSLANTSVRGLQPDCGSDDNALPLIKKEPDLRLDAGSGLSATAPFLPFGIPGGSKELAQDFVGGLDVEYNC